jgi:hypothetical protein
MQIENSVSLIVPHAKILFLTWNHQTIILPTFLVVDGSYTEQALNDTTH